MFICQWTFSWLRAWWKIWIHCGYCRGLFRGMRKLPLYAGRCYTNKILQEHPANVSLFYSHFDFEMLNFWDAKIAPLCSGVARKGWCCGILLRTDNEAVNWEAVALWWEIFCGLPQSDPSWSHLSNVDSIPNAICYMKCFSTLVRLSFKWDCENVLASEFHFRHFECTGF